MKWGPPLISLAHFERSCPLHIRQTDPPLPNAAHTLLFDMEKKTKPKPIPLFQRDFSTLFRANC